LQEVETFQNASKLRKIQLLGLFFDLRGEYRFNEIKARQNEYNCLRLRIISESVSKIQKIKFFEKFLTLQICTILIFKYKKLLKT